MTTIDLTPFYRNTIGFDRLSSLLDAAMSGDQATQNSYPPYNIEVTGENEYAVTVAVAGFSQDELDIQVENSTLTVRGKRAPEGAERTYLYKGIANRSFERKFNLADHVQVTEASLNNGLLVIRLVREVPERLKPRRIPIAGGSERDAIMQDEASTA